MQARRIVAEVREAMSEKGISQRELSALVGIPLNTLSRRLTSTRRGFDLVELIDVAAALGLTLTDLALRAERRALSSTAA